MRRSGQAGLLALMLHAGGPAAAEPLPEGCFLGEYGAAHLAARPAQTVERLAVRLAPHERDGRLWAEALVEARFRRDGEAHVQWLHCRVPGQEEPGAAGAALVCGVDCDGGTFAAHPRADGSLLLATRGFVVAGGCGSARVDPETGDLVVPPMRRVADAGAVETRFLLRPAVPEACPGLR